MRVLGAWLALTFVQRVLIHSHSLPSFLLSSALHMSHHRKPVDTIPPPAPLPSAPCRQLSGYGPGGRLLPPSGKVPVAWSLAPCGPLFLNDTILMSVAPGARTEGRGGVYVGAVAVGT